MVSAANKSSTPAAPIIRLFVKKVKQLTAMLKKRQRGWLDISEKREEKKKAPSRQRQEPWVREN